MVSTNQHGLTGNSFILDLSQRDEVGLTGMSGRQMDKMERGSRKVLLHVVMKRAG